MIRSTLVISLSVIGLTVLASIESVLLSRSSIIEQPINQVTPLTNVSDLFEKVQPGDAPLLLKTYLSSISSADELVQGSELARIQEQSRDAPLTLKIYLFNITNAHEIKQGSVWPRLQEVGPYVFREKNSITGLNMSQQATKEPEVNYQFDADSSRGQTLDDLITHVNLPLMVLIGQVTSGKEHSYVDSIFRAVITTQKEDPFPTRSARDLIYGYREKMVVKIQQAAKALKFPFPVISDTIGILSGKTLLPYAQDWDRILQDSSLPLCLLNSSLDISSCKHTPIVTSFHFNEVTPCLHQNRTAMHPDAEELDTPADVEPQTELTLRGAKRLQVNARLSRYVRIQSVSHLPNLLIPFTRFEEGVELNEAPNEQFNSPVASKLTSSIPLSP